MLSVRLTPTGGEERATAMFSEWGNRVVCQQERREWSGWPGRRPAVLEKARHSQDADARARCLPPALLLGSAVHQLRPVRVALAVWGHGPRWGRVSRPSSVQATGTVPAGDVAVQARTRLVPIPVPRAMVPGAFLVSSFRRRMGHISKTGPLGTSSQSCQGRGPTSGAHHAAALRPGASPA